MSDGQGKLHRIQMALVSWGVWPAAVMVLAQLEVARLYVLEYDVWLGALTAAGTMAIYGADRFVERLMLRRLEARHNSGLRDIIFPIIVLALGLYGLYGADGYTMEWLMILGLSGALYLAFTTGVLPCMPMGKELLGAVIFAVLVWGWNPYLDRVALLAFIPLGLSNFLLASIGDRKRDAANGIRSLAVSHPEVVLVLARAAASFSMGFFIFFEPAGSYFILTAAAHMLWFLPAREIDLAFCTLLAVPFAYLMN